MRCLVRISSSGRAPSVWTAIAVLAVVLTAWWGFPNSLEADMVARWAFEDDFSDSSAYGNDLSIAGGNPGFSSTVPPWGISTKSASFDGDDWLHDTSPNGLGFTSAYTFAAWVKSPLPAAGKFHGIFWRGVSGSSSDIEIYTAYTGAFTVAHNRGNAGSFDYVYFPTTPNDTMFHLAVTYDYSELCNRVRVYYDGVEQTHYYQDPNLAKPLATAGYDVSIGKLDGTLVNSFYNGLLDEVFVFDRALTKGEVVSLAVPEPSTLLLLAIGLLALVAHGRRRRKETIHDC